MSALRIVCRRSRRLARTSVSQTLSTFTRSKKRSADQLGSVYTEDVGKRCKPDVYEDPSGFKTDYNNRLGKWAAKRGKPVVVIDGPSARSSNIFAKYIKPERIHAVTNKKDFALMRNNAPRGVSCYNADFFAMFQSDYGDSAHPIGKTFGSDGSASEDSDHENFGVIYADLMGGTPNSTHQEHYPKYQNMINTLVRKRYLRSESIFALTTCFYIRGDWSQHFCITPDALEKTVQELFKDAGVDTEVIECNNYRDRMCTIILRLI